MNIGCTADSCFLLLAEDLRIQFSPAENHLHSYRAAESQWAGLHIPKELIKAEMGLHELSRTE